MPRPHNIPAQVAALQGQLRWIRESLETIADTANELGSVPAAAAAAIKRSSLAMVRAANDLEDATKRTLDTMIDARGGADAAVRELAAAEALEFDDEGEVW